MKRTIPIILCFALFCFGCAPAMRPFHWLRGTWEMTKPNGSVMLETWEIKDAKTLTGRGLKVMGGDTSLQETLSIHMDEKDLWYTPVVPDQNNGKPVPFKLVDVKTNQYTFENPEHDFPQRIKYDFKPVKNSQPPVASIGDTMDVAVTGLNGEGIHFRFTRKYLK